MSKIVLSWVSSLAGNKVDGATRVGASGQPWLAARGWPQERDPGSRTPAGLRLAGFITQHSNGRAPLEQVLWEGAGGCRPVQKVGLGGRLARVAPGDRTAAGSCWAERGRSTMTSRKREWKMMTESSCLKSCWLVGCFCSQLKKPCRGLTTERQVVKRDVTTWVLRDTEESSCLSTFSFSCEDA